MRTLRIRFGNEKDAGEHAAIAASTRSSVKPRARSCDSTISSAQSGETFCFRIGLASAFKNKPNPPSRSAMRLFLSPADAQVEADHAVLVAQANDGDIAGDVVLHLNDLLRGLGTLVL